jgi:hypothetical protein
LAVVLLNRQNRINLQITNPLHLGHLLIMYFVHPAFYALLLHVNFLSWPCIKITDFVPLFTNYDLSNLSVSSTLCILIRISILSAISQLSTGNSPLGGVVRGNSGYHTPALFSLSDDL